MANQYRVTAALVTVDPPAGHARHAVAGSIVSGDEMSTRRREHLLSMKMIEPIDASETVAPTADAA
jgi:phage terminase large subunit-like protein